MDDEQRATGPAPSSYCGCEVLAPPQPILGRQHVMTCTRSGGQAGATLATAGRQNGTTGARAHTETETVGLRATTVVRLEGALAHSGAPEMNRVMAGHRLAVTVRPRVAREYARVHRFTTTDRDHCPSEAGGSSHRQLDLVTVRATTPSGQTGPYSGPHCAQAVDNNLNRAGRPDYLGGTPKSFSCLSSPPVPRTTHSWDLRESVPRG